MEESDIKPIIVCIAKQEHNYIEEFVKYHLAIGFNHIYLYDNEDIPTYQDLLHKYSDKITFIHMPGKFITVFNPETEQEETHMVQYGSLIHFIQYYISRDDITHIMHIDIDEYVVLKKCNNIKTFIKKYIEDDETCGGIMFHWRWFGDSGNTPDSWSIPNTLRFTKCGIGIDACGKTIFNKQRGKYNNIHYISCNPGMVSKSLDIMDGQLNHYKTKTWEEYQIIRQRGRADIQFYEENIAEDFNRFNQNEIEDLYAFEFYKKHCL